MRALSNQEYSWCVSWSLVRLSITDIHQSNSRVHCNIGFAELAVNLPNSHVDDTVPVLIEILRDILYIDFDHCLAWDGAFSTNE